MRADALKQLRKAVNNKDRLQFLRKELRDAKKRGATETEIDDLEEAIDETTRINPPPYRAILSLGIPGLSFHTDRGETIRYLVPGHRIILWIAPLGERFSSTGIQPNIRNIYCGMRLCIVCILFSLNFIKQFSYLF